MFRRRSVQDTEEELRDFLLRDEEDLIERGMAPADAHRAAIVRIGSIAARTEEIRSAGWEWAVEPGGRTSATALACTDAARDLRRRSLWPAIVATRVKAHPDLKDLRPFASGATYAGRALLTLQVAVSLVLLITAGLFVSTLRNLQRTDPGFNGQNLVLFRAAFPRSYKPTEPLTVSYARLVARVSSIPGVSAVTYGQHHLIGGDLAMPALSVPGHPRVDGEDRTVYYSEIGPAFLETMQIPLVAGRSLTASDTRAGSRVALVNQTLARRFFGDEPPIGRRIGITKDPLAPDVPEREQLEIVGVIGDTRQLTLREAPLPAVLFAGAMNTAAQFAVRASVPAPAVINAIRDAARASVPSLNATAFRTQDEQIAISVALERHLAIVSSFFGAVALLLTTIGLYALLSYRVAQRTQEIGVRIAVGASRSMVVRGVFAQTGFVIAIGVAAGLLSAAAVTRTLSGLLFGLSPQDPGTIALAVATLAGAVLMASTLPARRAARVDPVVALRD